MFYSKSIAELYDYIDALDVTLTEAIAAAVTESKEYTDGEASTLAEAIVAAIATANGYTDDSITGLPSIGNGNIRTGTYTGDGQASQEIDIGVDLTTKNNQYVIIKGENAYEGVHRIEYEQGGGCMRYEKEVDFDHAMLGCSVNGFTVDWYARVNAVGIVFRYIVFWTD